MNMCLLSSTRFGLALWFAGVLSLQGYSGGIVTVKILENDFSYVAVPYQNAAVFEGTVQAVEPDRIRVAPGSFDANAFAGDAVGRPRFYLRLVSGDLAGLCLGVSGNGTDFIQVHTVGRPLDDLGIGRIGLDDSFEIVRFLTVADVFGTGGEVVEVTPVDADSLTDYLILMDPLRLGGTESRLVYADADGTWRVDGFPEIDAGPEVLWPGRQVVVRNTGGPKILMNLGPVDYRRWIFPYTSEGDGNGRQLIRLSYPGVESRSLPGLGLRSGDSALNVFTASSSPFRPNDLLKVEQFDGSDGNATTFFLYITSRGWTDTRGRSVPESLMEILPGAALTVYKRGNDEVSGYWLWDFDDGSE